MIPVATANGTVLSKYFSLSFSRGLNGGHLSVSRPNRSDAHEWDNSERRLFVADFVLDSMA